MYAKLYLDEEELLQGSSKEPTSKDLSNVRFGEHTLRTDRYIHRSWMVISAFFQEPNGRIALYDKSNKSMVTNTMFSRRLDNLRSPKF